MSGGTHEFVAGYTTGAGTVGGSSGINNLYSDFFNNSEYTKYWDKYTSTATYNFSNRILGDATGELGPFFNQRDPDGNNKHKSSWYGDYAIFANSSSPWFARGAMFDHGTVSGIFAFNSHLGARNEYYGFRLVLTPQ